jgi:hypothetical protein
MRHHPLREASASVRLEDVHVTMVGKRGVIGHDPHEANLLPCGSDAPTQCEFATARATTARDIPIDQYAVTKNV